MKKLLSIILIISACNASAQTYVKDTTEVDATLQVIPKTGAAKYDKLGVHPTITGQVNKATSDIAGLQSTVAPLPGLINNLSSRVTTLEQGIPITVIDTPKRINVTGTSYTIGEGDNGANIFCYSTCTIYAGHGTGGYKVNVYRLSGVVKVSGLSGITVLSVLGYNKISQYGEAEIIYEGPTRVLLTGQLAK